jgi:site-specific DNA recombinase
MIHALNGDRPHLPCRGARRGIDAAATSLPPKAHHKPQSSRPEPIPVTAIARGRQWLSEIETGTATTDGIASRQACSERHVSITISLAFLAPSLVKAAVAGRLPDGIGVARLFDAPVAWSCQQQMLAH